MHKQSLEGDRIFLIRDFLTPTECREQIAASERVGYEAATITFGGQAVEVPEIRNNNRVIVDDPQLAERWLNRVRGFLPELLDDSQLCGLNERFRYYRYTPGQSFQIHRDGAYHRSRSEVSMLTFIVYLNDGFGGGSTDFYSNPLQRKLSVRPEVGAALIFDPKELHEGAEVTHGVKYALRTDVMYRVAHP